MKRESFIVLNHIRSKLTRMMRDQREQGSRLNMLEVMKKNREEESKRRREEESKRRRKEERQRVREQDRKKGREGVSGVPPTPLYSETRPTRGSALPMAFKRPNRLPNDFLGAQVAPSCHVSPIIQTRQIKGQGSRSPCE